MSSFDAIKRREDVLVHAVKRLTDGEWQTTQQRAGAFRSDMSTVRFYLRNQNTEGAFVVGKDARDIGTRYQGIEKYQPGAGDAYVIAGLIKMFPQGHDNIILGLGHPPNAASRVQEFMSLLGGTHYVELPNRNKIKFKIRYIKPYDENEGGIVRTLSRSQTYNILQQLNVGDFVMMTDIGGRVGTMYFAELGQSLAPYINWERGVTFEFGIEDIKEQLNTVLRENTTDFNWDVPDKILEDIIRTRGRHVVVNGVNINYVDLYNHAIQPFLNQFKARFNGNIIKGASDAVQIFNTGGGSGALFEILNEDVYGRTCVLADDFANINLANMRGMLYAMYFWAKRSQNDPRFSKLLSSNPVIVIADAGNSYLKIGVCNE